MKELAGTVAASVLVVLIALGFWWTVKDADRDPFEWSDAVDECIDEAVRQNLGEVDPADVDITLIMAARGVTAGNWRVTSPYWTCTAVPAQTGYTAVVDPR